MKTCNEFEEMISTYIDDELDDHNVSSLFRHLGDCTDCRSVLRSMYRLRAAFQETENIRPEVTAQSFWKRSIAVTYSSAALIAGLTLFTAAVLFIQVSTGGKKYEQDRIEYVSSRPLPTVYVIEPSENIIHLN